jgi:transposase
MGRVTRAAAHLPVEDVKKRAKTDPRYGCRHRWLILSNALGDPRPASAIAKHGGVAVETVHQLISTYKRFGVVAVQTAGKGGRHKEYLTVEQEQQLLAPLFARAATGEIATAGEIKRAFETQVGHEVDESTIYRWLNRQGWRKLVPRPVPPQASKEAQDQFKKPLRRRWKRRWQRAHQKTAAPC